MARERKVFPRETVAHLWVHKAQDEARDAGGNFYFTGPTLYSYGSHFVCGHHMPDAYAVDGSPLVIINANTYSNTTARHMAAMRQALPRYFERFEIPGLRSDDVYSIERHGARSLADKALAAMRDAARDAAFPRIKQPRRAAAIESAQRFAAIARHLATVDVGRRDLEKEKRANARAVLRGLPAADAFPAIVLTGEHATNAKDAARLCEEFASLVARDEYRESARVFAARFNNAAAKVETYATEFAAGNVSEAWDAVRSAETARGLAESCADLFDNARNSFRMGKQSLPAGMAKRAQAIAAMLPELKAREAVEQRAGHVNKFAHEMGRARYLLAHDRASSYDMAHTLSALDTACGNCATLDTPEEQAARVTALQALRNEVDAYATATAGERARYALEQARRELSDGGFNAVEGLLQQAERIARNETESETERDAINREAAVIRAQWATATEAQRVELIAEWRNGRGSVLDRDMTQTDGGALLRVRGGVIETSWGASVPVSVAPLVWRAATQCRTAHAAHEFTRETAPRLGPFTLDHIGADGSITAGCHFIQFDEVRRVAVTLGYITEQEPAA